MRIDLENWCPLTDANATVSGLLHIKLTYPDAIYLVQDGVETLVHYGAEFKCTFEGTAVVRVGDDIDSSDAWIYVPPGRTVECDPEVFTNADMQPQESGSLQFVKQGLRLIELQKKQMMADIRAELAKSKAAKKHDEKPEEVAEENSEDTEDDQVEENSSGEDEKTS